MENRPITSKKRYQKLGTRMALSFSILAVISIFATGSALFLNFRNQIQEDMRQRLISIISITALQQDGDLHATLQNRGDDDSEAFQKIKATNAAIIATDPNIAYLYTMRKDDQGNIYFVVDTGPAGSETQPFLDIYPDAGATLVNNFSTMESAIAESEFYTDEDGTFLSAYAPFYRSDGTREGVIGVDINASTVVAREREFLTLTIISMMVAIPFVALFGWLLGSYLAAPLSRLTGVAQKVADGYFSLRADVNPNSQEVFELQTNFNSMTGRVEDLISNLETRVAERTAELELRSQELETSRTLMETRADQLRTIALISRNITSIQNLDLLLPEITRLISDAFGFYHIGIFLIDENNQFAVLRASNSLGGQRMLERQHRLQIGRTGLVGSVAQSGKGRIALDTGADAIYFNNPDLPETHSEIALPLQSGNRTIGVLDVQSNIPNAFSQDDIETLSILADQIASAIQTTRSFEETRKALEETERVYRSYIRQEWRNQLSRQENNSFQYDITGVRPMVASDNNKSAKKSKKPATTIPIKIRDEIVGVLNVQSVEDQPIDQDELDIVEATAERIALAIENARLIEDSQRRASKERTIGDISGRISTLTNINTILQTAVQELGATIADADITIRLNTEIDQD